MNKNINSFAKDSKARCLKYRKRILDISQTVRAIHAAGAFSAIEMLDSIYYGLMRKDKKGKECRKVFVILECANLLGVNKK